MTGRTEGPRTVLVTGAARGVGLAVGEHFAREGDHVAVLDIDAEGAEEAAERIRTHGGQALSVACDVRSRDSVEAAVEATVDRFGRLDIVVSNAGILRDNLLFKMTDDEWDAVIGTHLTGSFYLARAAQRHMVSQQYGKLIFMSSRSALGQRGQTNYAAAKAGLQGMTRTLAIELGPFGVNVNAVAPGHIETDMTRATAARMGVSYDELKEQVIAANAIKRVGQPQDVASAVAFLASDAASYITGQVLYIAGRPTI